MNTQDSDASAMAKIYRSGKGKSEQKGTAERCLPHNKGVYEVDYNLEGLVFIFVLNQLSKHLDE